MAETAPLAGLPDKKYNWAKFKRARQIATSASAAILLSACRMDDLDDFTGEYSPAPNEPDAMYNLSCPGDEQLQIQVPEQTDNGEPFYTVAVDVELDDQSTTEIKFNLPTIDRSNSLTAREADSPPQYRDPVNNATHLMLDGQIEYTILTDDERVIQSIIVACNQS